MILIAENLNSSIPFVQKALAARDEAALSEIIHQLDACPADYLDLNAGVFHDSEADVLTWLIRLVRRHSSKPLVLDSPDPAVLRTALPLAGPGLLINSITLEPRRYQAVLSLAKESSAGLIALLMHEERMPQGVEERLEIAERLLNGLQQAGVAMDRVFLDPMIRPVATDDQAGLEGLTTIKALRQRFPAAHVVIGLSNVSFGLPARRYLNRAFLLQGMACGLDSAILNPLDKELLALWRAGLVLAGEDEYCQSYLEHYR